MARRSSVAARRRPARPGQAGLARKPGERPRSGARDARRDNRPGGARAARTTALDILEGEPIDGKAYSWLPLLNWNSPAKVKTVPAGGEVTVSEARFGEHVIRDTLLLEFEDPEQPFSITYRIAELGPGLGGALAPTPLLSDGAKTVGGLHSAIQPLALQSEQTGTLESSRFHPDGAAERTRRAIQEITVR